jgi:hypothetical protein
VRFLESSVGRERDARGQHGGKAGLELWTKLCITQPTPKPFHEWRFIRGDQKEVIHCCEVKHLLVEAALGESAKKVAEE